jgi:hypothetical protein
MKWYQIVLGAACAMLLVFNSRASVLYVDLNCTNPTPPYVDWSTASTDIQSAVDASSDGDLILVTNGVYQTGGHVVYGNAMNRVAITKPLTILSINGPSVTTILGDVYPHYEYGTRCAYLTNGVVMSGFTLSSGRVGFGSDYYDFSGGGIYAETGAMISNCVLSANSVYSAGTGGGVTGGTLVNCSISGNSVPQLGNVTPDGGGAYKATLVNCIVFGNSSGGYGGGADECTLSNCTLVGNYAAVGGGVSFCTLYNSIVYFNSNNWYVGDYPNYIGTGFAYCCTTPDPGGTGNIVSDPTFINSTNNDFHLLPTSLCINSGNNAYATTATDFDGNSRIVGGTVDIGAYEDHDLTVVIITQPASQTNLIGQTGTLNIAAISPYSLSYQWQFNSNNIPGSTNSSLIITNLQLTNAGVYRASVSAAFSNSVVTVDSFNAVLTIFYPPPVIIQQPTNLAVIVGSNTMFSVIATNSAPISFQWQLNGTNLVDGGEFSGSTNSMLSISGVQIADAGNYQVIVANRDLSVASAVAALTVVVPAAIASQPTNQIVVISNNASFSILATGTTNLAYQWYFNGAPLMDGGRMSGSASATLNISSVQTNDEGSYHVIVTNVCGSATSEVATLTVLVPAQIVQQPASESVLLTSNASFSVSTTGTDLGYQWYLNDSPMSDNGRVSGATTAALGITDIQSGDAGNYHVVVSNVLNVVTSTPAALTPLTSLSPSIRYVNVNNSNPESPYLDWDTAATDIQDATDAAVDGDLILVTNGVYATGGRVVYGSLTNRVVINKAVTVQSVNGPAVTAIQGYQVPGTINGNSAVRCVYLTNNASLIGFTLCNGATRSSGDSIKEESGGGIWCESTNNVVVSNCVITANAAFNQGGGAYQGNLVNCTLVNNICNGNGGGASSAFLSSCTMATNSAASGGGAYSGVLMNCIVTANASTNSTGGGGGTCSSIVFNSAIADNSAANNSQSYYTQQGGYGGGAYGGSLVNCTITGNHASIGGGVASCALTNCIVYYNTYFSNVFGLGPMGVSNYFSIGASFDHCCTTPLPYGTGNITNGPVLASVSHISLDSPCVGAGNAAVTRGTDIDGEPWANPPSIGCDELYPGNAIGDLSVSISTVFTNLAPGYGEVFQANNSGPVTATKWDFGDGTVVSNTPYALHAWSSVGDYTVTLTAYNDTYPTGQTATLMMHITVPTVYYVDLNSAHPVAPYSYWSTAATTIQDAVDAATPGSLVLVTNAYSITRNDSGYHTNRTAIYQTGGRIIYGSLSNRVAVTKPLTLQSVNGASATFIDGGRSGRCVYLTNGASLVGFTLTNGWVNQGGDQTKAASGGGIWCESTNDVITNCVITGCFASYEGSGACSGSYYNCTIISNYFSSSSSPVSQYGGGAYSSILNNCMLIGNTSQNGAGAASSVANNCVFSNNYGGGAYLCVLANCTLIGNIGWIGGGSYGGTISNCIYAGNSANSGGGAAGGTINNCTFVRNSATGGGGGVYGVSTFPSVLNNCIISNNTALFGGGVYVSLPQNSNNFILNNCAIIGNVATNTGGGSYLATLNDCAVSSNTAYAGGGIEGGVLNNCSLSGNIAHNGGGADGSMVVPAPILNNCILSGNVATNSSSGGGGAAGSILSNCMLSGNIAYSGGGGSLGGGGGAAYSTLNGCLVVSNSAPGAFPVFNNGNGGGTYQCLLTNCVLACNTAETNGGGDYQSTLVNCTVVSNSAPLGGGTVNSKMLNSIIYYNSGGNYYRNPYGTFSLGYCCTTPLTNGPGNITNEPDLVNLAAGDFHLQSNSPCINSGNNAFVTSATDLDGNQRISGGTVDIGAYEYQNPASVLSYAWAQQYGLPTDGSADYADTDGTGMNNWQKWIAGLNPTNPASVLAMQSPSATNNAGGITVTWQSVNTRTYYLQRAMDLTAQPAFSAIQSNLVGQAGTTSYTDTTATNGGPYFYRVGVQ